MQLAITPVVVLIKGRVVHVPLSVGEHVSKVVEEPVDWPVMEPVLVLLSIIRQNEPTNEILVNVNVISVQPIQ